MLSGSTALITTTFKCPSMNPCGAALMDALAASIRKMQAAVTEFGTDDIRIKRQDRIVSSSPEFTGNSKTAGGGPLSKSTDGGYGPPRSSLQIPCECVAA